MESERYEPFVPGTRNSLLLGSLIVQRQLPFFEAGF
jgi:hypothetical protein